MIDPDGLQITNVNGGNIININAKNIEPCDIEVYCLDDEKEYEKFIKDVESQVRRSYEYKEFIKYIRDNMGMNKCAFLKDISNQESYDIKIEIHHYPFTLRDITEVVIRKRMYYKESLTIQMTAKEIMELHYKLIVGLIPLSETVHELAHNSRLFIPTDKVLGRYNLFIDYYKPFCDPEQLETLSRIEKYTEEKQSRILDTTILDQNNVSYQIADNRFMLPDTSNLNNAMMDRMKLIKENNYLLPTIDESNKLIEDKAIYNKEPIKAISFDYTLIKK